jgi:hypothetical protein
VLTAKGRKMGPVFALPFPRVDSKVPSFDVERDFGPVVKGISDSGKKADGKCMLLSLNGLRFRILYAAEADV